MIFNLHCLNSLTNTSLSNGIFSFRLCKLLTSPVTDVKDLVADFLFVLCKEKGNKPFLSFRE